MERAKVSGYRSVKTQSELSEHKNVAISGKHGIINEPIRIPQKRASSVSEKIRNGEYSVSLSKQQYLKHVEGSAQYKIYLESRLKKGGNPQSVITIDENSAQELIREKSGTGIVGVSRAGEEKPTESINCGRVIGKYYGNGEYHDTTKATIHYGKKGSHIVPIRGDDFD